MPPKRTRNKLERRKLIPTPMAGGRLLSMAMSALEQALHGRKEDQKALLASKQCFDRLVNTIPFALYDYVRWPDGSNQFIYMSPKCERIFECDADSIIQDSSVLWNMVHPDDLERLREEDRVANEAHIMFQSEVRIVLPTGRVKWVELTSMPSDQQIDEQDIWSGVIQDITARKQIEQERNGLMVELKKALAEIKTLRGILPICSFCKKIRDEKGNWEAVEVYVAEHSGAGFSHSLCPDCAKAQYPNMRFHQD